MSTVKDDIAAGVETFGNINNVVSLDSIVAFKKRLAARGVVATDAMINAVLANGGKWTVEKYKKRFTGGWSHWVERYPTEHWTEMSDTGHFSVADWRYHGAEDCKNGLPCQSDNIHYQSGYGRQYETEQKESALCLH